MKIGIITASVSRNAGGLFFSVRSLAKQLAKNSSAHIDVHGLEDGHTAADLAAWSPLPVTVHARALAPSLGIAPKLRPILEASAYDLLHTQGIWQGPSASVHGWSRSNQRPYLVSPRGMLDPWALSRSRWKKRIASFFYESAHLRNAACIHALCQSESASIRAYGLENPICVIPNGVDLPAEVPSHVDCKPENERKTLVFLGRIHPKKGLTNAIKAWKQTLDSVSRHRHVTPPRWNFVIAGWDQNGHETGLKRLCVELDISHETVSAEHFLLHPHGSSPPGTITFVGPAFGGIKDKLLRRADAFILPSFSEGLPMAVLEAWAYRLPVLMTDHCNLPAGFSNDAAIRIDANPDSISQGLADLFKLSGCDLQAIGSNGRALIESQFTWTQVAEQMIAVYEWVLGRGTRPECVSTMH